MACLSLSQRLSFSICLSLCLSLLVCCRLRVTLQLSCCILRGVPLTPQQCWLSSPSPAQITVSVTISQPPQTALPRYSHKMWPYSPAWGRITWDVWDNVMKLHCDWPVSNQQLHLCFSFSLSYRWFTSVCHQCKNNVGKMTSYDRVVKLVLVFCVCFCCCFLFCLASWWF